MEYTITNIITPSTSGCQHVHVTLNDENGATHLRSFHMSDFEDGGNEFKDDPVAAAVQKKVKDRQLSLGLILGRLDAKLFLTLNPSIEI